MSKEAKYITYKMRSICGEWQPHIFPFSSNLIHKNVVENMIGGPRKIVSAGFIRFTDGKPYCYGKSVSLGLESRPDEDTMLAELAFGE